MFQIYRRMWLVTWAEQWQYRANLLMYLLYWLVSPIVYLAVWSTVARGHGTINGLSPNDFTTYYLILLIVDNLTSQIVIHQLAYKIQDGTLAGELLKPVHPILTNTLMNGLAFKVLNFAVLIPIWIVLCLLFQPDFSSVTFANVLLAIPALVCGFAINFLFGATITCIAFWTTRVYALNEFYQAMVMLYGGLFVPIALLPEAMQQGANVLPFQLLISFPIQLILGRLTPEQMQTNFILDAVWVAVALVLFQLTFRAGVKRFSAVGA